MDVNQEAVIEALENINYLIHGHTHRLKFISRKQT
jgi:UDP-2,3-diacylglucosamine hydrolase